MQRRPRICYTENQRALMWERWRKGDSLHQIAQLFDRHHPSIQGSSASHALCRGVKAGPRPP